MSKKSRENEKLEQEENAALIAKIETFQKSFDEAFTDIGNTKDQAEKILKLRSLDNTLWSAGYAIDRERDRLISTRTQRSVKSRRKRIRNRILAVPTIGYTTIVSDQFSQKSQSEEQQKLMAHAEINAFKKGVADNRARVATMLDETVKNCDLKEISQSKHFPDALHDHDALRKKFDAAAIARAALGEDCDQPKAAADGSPAKLRVQQSPVLQI